MRSLITWSKLPEESWIFGKSREAFRTKLSLQEIINDAVLLVRLKLKQSQVILEIDEFEEVLIVYVDKGQIQQALLNLMLNALVAMPAGGKLTLKSDKSDEGKALIFVSDTGSVFLQNYRVKFLIHF